MIRTIIEYILLFMYSMLNNNTNFKNPYLKTINTNVPTNVTNKHINIFDKDTTYDEDENGPIWF